MADQTKCMDKIPQGVFIVGTRMNDSFDLMTAAFVTQVSFQPCSLALSVANDHYTAQLIREQGQFSLSVLEAGQVLEAKSCGYQSGRTVDKAKRMKLHLTPQGLPIVDDAAAWMVCTVKQTVAYEDHTVFLAEIVDGADTPGQPMIYNSAEFF